jgi:hypothetical protein
MGQTEIVFSVQESSQGGYEARAIGYSILNQGETMEELTANVKDAIACHFDKKPLPAFSFVKTLPNRFRFGSAKGEFTVPEDFDSADQDIEKVFYEGDPSSKDPLG